MDSGLLLLNNALENINREVESEIMLCNLLHWSYVAYGEGFNILMIAVGNDLDDKPSSHMMNRFNLYDNADETAWFKRNLKKITTKFNPQLS